MLRPERQNVWETGWNQSCLFYTLKIRFKMAKNVYVSLWRAWRMRFQTHFVAFQPHVSLKRFSFLMFKAKCKIKDKLITELDIELDIEIVFVLLEFGYNFNIWTNDLNGSNQQ